MRTERRYVGSAYSADGLWGRWSQYALTGHGGKVELRALVDDPSLEYVRRNFRFALLEHRASHTSDEAIQGREAYWKRILMTRGESGVNRNQNRSSSESRRVGYTSFARRTVHIMPVARL